MGLNKDFLCVEISFTIPLFIHSKTAHLCNVNYMLGIVGEERSRGRSMQREIHMISKVLFKIINIQKNAHPHQ